jgi:preflagellin peptidase FlaK
LQAILDWIRITITLAFLLYASWSDHKTREVSNTVWIFFAPVALILTLVEIYISDSSGLVAYAVSFGLTAALAIVLFYAGGFGGADSKALMCLALALPFYPSSTLTPIFGETSPQMQLFFPITVFSNSVILAGGMVIIILLRNMSWRMRTHTGFFEKGQEKETWWKKLLVLLTGYKMPLQRLKEKWHLYPLEDVEEDSEKGFRRKLVLVPKDEGREAILERLEKAVNAGAIQNQIWTSPGLPQLIFVTAGLVIALFGGDIIWSCIRLLLT